jgi:pimeloyl-ACP methyl ester carboxylesterase
VKILLKYYVLLLVFILNSVSVLAENNESCQNIYYQTSNTLSLTCLSVKLSENISINYIALFSLSIDQFRFYFDLDFASANTTAITNTACTATYDVATGLLKIPCFIMQSGTKQTPYRAILQKITDANNALRFVVIDIAEKTTIPEVTQEVVTTTVDPTPTPPKPEPIIPNANVLLLLHGMNSDEGTWNEYIDNEPALQNIGNYTSEKCPTVMAGVVLGNTALSPTIPNLRCFRVRFGSYDASSTRRGLQNIIAQGSQSGDFSTFEQLGKEVQEAITGIQQTYQQAYGSVNLKVTLLAHSRGGLAARAFLQQPSNSTEKQSVTALLTTGTPHYGSPLGRIYQYLKTNCLYSNGSRKGERSFFGFADDCLNDWQVVDTIRLGKCNGITVSENRLDVRTPTINDLSDRSTAINTLKNNANRLPQNIIYAALKYTGVELGRLERKYRIFDLVGIDYCDQVSSVAKNYLLSPSGGVRGENLGDGIVPLLSQDFPLGVTTIPLRNNPRTASDLFHVKEPQRQSEISDALYEILPDWDF